MSNRSKAAAVLAAAVSLSTSASFSQAALSFNVGGTWDTDARKASAVAAMTAVVNRYNAYGNFGNYNIYVYYNSGIQTAQANYEGSIGFGGTYPNERVAQHESNHYLGSGTYLGTSTIRSWASHFTDSKWTGAKVNALFAQFDGDGTVMKQSGVHFYGYGLNYDSEVINNDILPRNIAVMYAMRQDMGIGTQTDPWSATSVQLRQSDALGTSGFNRYNSWNDNYFAHPNAAYSTGVFTMRTPLDTYNPSAATPSFTFAGESLTVNSGGVLLYKGVGTTGLLTFNNLILDGGLARHASSAADLFQVAGKVTVASASSVAADQGNIKILANIVGSAALTKTGSFTLTLTGNNSRYTGDVSVTAGTLQLGDGTAGHDGNLAGAAVTVAGGATLAFNPAGTTSAAYVIGGAGNVTKLGPGTLTLTAANTYTGTTTVSAGALQFGDGKTGGSIGGPISVAAGATVAFNPAAPAVAANAISGSGSVVKLGEGTQTLGGANTYAGTTSVTAGTLRATAAATDNLLTNAGGVDLADTAAARGTLALDYAAGDASPVDRVKAILTAAYAGHFAAGNLRSTTLAANHTLGYGDTGSSVVVRVTLPGDANLDGNVDFNDFLVLQNSFGQSDTRFDQGNFDYDGATDFNDFLVLQNNFGQSLTGTSAAFNAEQVAAITAFANNPANASVPEPAAIGLIGVAAAGLLRRRRHSFEALSARN